jgi:hypothetical protein
MVTSAPDERWSSISGSNVEVCQRIAIHDEERFLRADRVSPTAAEWRVVGRQPTEDRHLPRISHPHIHRTASPTTAGQRV